MSVVPTSSENLLIDKDSQEFVERWLNENKNWFQSHAIENLDLNTVEKWLNMRNQKICQCKPVRESKSLTNFQRRKSFPSNLFDLSNKKDEIPSELISHHFQKPFAEDKNQVKKEPVRSNSFNTLMQEEAKSQKENFETKERARFYLESEIESNKQNYTFLEKSIFAKRDSASNSQLLKLLKSKIKFPNKRKVLSFDEKMKLKNKINSESLLNFLIQDTSKEILPKDASLTIKTNLRVLVNCEYSSLFLFAKSHDRLYSYQYDTLFSKCDQSKCLLGNDADMQIASNSSILNKVLQSGDTILINSDEIKEMRYNLLFDKQTDIQINSVLCMALKNVDQEVIGLIQMTNKKGDGGDFLQSDVKKLEPYLEFCSTIMTKAQMYYLCAYEYERCRCLLEVLHDVFQQQTNLEQIFYQIMEKAQILLKCENCTILVYTRFNGEKKGLDEKKTFDVYQIGNKQELRRHSTFESDGSKISRGLVDYVLTTGKKVNIKDSSLHPIIDEKIDLESDYKAKANLLMPIRNVDGSIIGCVRVLNRLDNQPFDENDEQLLEVFCIFCGLGISNTFIYNKVEKASAEKTVALDVLSYHANVPKSEYDLFMKKIPSNEDFDIFNKYIEQESLSSYVFDDFCLNNDEMVMASYNMFKDLGLIKKFKIEKGILFQFLLTVRKNYRDIEYHNWTHAFNVCQNVYAIFKNSRISQYLQDTEKLALLVGCLCHDLDHRGTNNLFQIESHSPLSQLYGTQAPMEKHHFNHCIMILNTIGHNIFANAKPNTYHLLISLIKEAILATDMADHLNCREEFTVIARDENTDWNVESNKALLRKNLMTVVDLGSVGKPWKIHKKIVNLVTKEFFAQGKRERNELNIEPNAMMDERRSDLLPRLQIGWIDGVCLPLFENFANLCKTFEGHLERIRENRLNWSILDEHLESTPNKEVVI